jgi:hypothetical protein
MKLGYVKADGPRVRRWRASLRRRASRRCCRPAARRREGVEDGGAADEATASTLKRRRCVGPARSARTRAWKALLSALRAGALPNLTYTNLSLADPIHREILSGGMLPLLEDVDVRIDRGEHVAALAPLRHLKHLRSLGIECREALEAALPPFFPPSLKALHLDIVPSATLPLMLLELPSTLQASGARLEEVVIGETQDLSDLSAEGGAALANVLQRFSSTLKTVKLFGTGCSASWCRAS